MELQKRKDDLEVVDYIMDITKCKSSSLVQEMDEGEYAQKAAVAVEVVSCAAPSGPSPSPSSADADSRAPAASLDGLQFSDDAVNARVGALQSSAARTFMARVLSSSFD